MRKIDHSWDFANADTKYYTHGIHSYPAMMIPQVSRRIIAEYGKEAKNCYDPFCGSGSVLLEFQLAQKNCYGTDINPLAILISKVKTTNIPVRKLQESCSKIRNDIFSYRMGKKVKTPDFFNINYWFKEKTIKDLSLISESINKIKEQYVKNFFKVCFSETARKSSTTRGGEFKLYRINEKKLENYNPDAIEIFQKIVQKNLNAMQNLNESLGFENLPKIKIIETDITKRIPLDEESIDLIVSSPPYGDSRTTVAYGQFTRLSLQWLEFDEKKARQLDNMSLGGKPAKEKLNFSSPTFDKIISKISNKDEKRAKDVISFFNDFYKASIRMEKVMKPKSKICWVLGNRTVKDTKIYTDKIISEMFKEFGYRNSTTIVRRIPSKRMPKMNSPTNKPGVLSTTMNEESIIILERN